MGSSPALSARNRLGAIKRHHPDDIALIERARRDLAAAKLEDYVRKTVESAPPLSDDQRARIAALLRPSGGGRLAG